MDSVFAFPFERGGRDGASGGECPHPAHPSSGDSLGGGATRFYADAPRNRAAPSADCDLQPLLGEKSSGNQSSRAVKQQVAWQRNVAAKKRMEKVKRSNRGVNHASYEPVLVNETVGRKMTPRQEQCVGRALPLSVAPGAIVISSHIHGIFPAPPVARKTIKTPRNIKREENAERLRTRPGWSASTNSKASAPKHSHSLFSMAR